MAMFWTILQFVILFGLIIFVHELGHYLAAVLLGIPVAEFGFGYPPKLLKLFRWRGTDFTLNAIPFGGFVRFEEEGSEEPAEDTPQQTSISEEPLQEDAALPATEIQPDDESQSPETKKTQKLADPGIIGGITTAPKWKRFIILVAGAFMNFVFGILLLIGMFHAIGTPDTSRVIISDVAPNSPALQAGLKKNDLIKSLNGVAIDSSETLSQQIQSNLGKEIRIVVLRDGNEISASLTPRENPPEGQGAIGIVMGNPSLPAKFGDTVNNAFKTFWAQVKTTLSLPVKLIQGAVKPEEARLVGIKGIFDLFQYAEKTDQAIGTSAPITRLWMASSITIAIGITNLLPIPALDGGQILFLLIEAITRKKISERVMNTINTIFFILLIALMIFITVRDFIHPILPG